MLCVFLFLYIINIFLYFMEKINMTVGRFQPFTQGHLNMVNEGNAKCIIYQIIPPSLPNSISDLKIKGKKVKKQQVQNVLNFLNGEDIDLTNDEKEILKRPFTNELIKKEFDIVKKLNSNILDIVYVKNVFDAFDRFNLFCTENKDKYEPQYWMCGDDRVDTYSDIIDKYPELETSLGSKEIIPNILSGKLKTNIGKGRTEGISGTAVRNSIISDNKAEFEKIMPSGVGKMFNDFKEAFNSYKRLLENIITEWRYTSLYNYIVERYE